MEKLKIKLLDLDGNELFYGKASLLKLDEKIIIGLSIKYFDDDSPCFIHKSAVMKKIFCQIEIFFEDKIVLGECEWLLNTLPSDLIRYFNQYKGLHKITIN